MSAPAEATGRRPLPPIALVGGAVVSIQLGAAFATTIFDELSPTGTTFLRLALAAPLLWLIWRPAIGGMRSEAVATAAVYGLILAAMNVCFYLSIDRIPLGIAVAFEFTGPLAVAIFASRRALDLVWVTLAGIGIFLLSPGVSGSVDGAGAALALAAGFFWGLYILISVRVGSALEGGTGVAIGLTVGAIALAPAGIIEAGSALLEPHLLAAAAGVAVLSSAIPYSLELEALRRLSAGAFGVLMSLEPAVGAVIGLIALGQGLALTEAVAIGLIVTASAGALGSGPGFGGKPRPLEA